VPARVTRSTPYQTRASNTASAMIPSAVPRALPDGCALVRQDLAQQISELAGRETPASWQFAEELGKITSSDRDDALLESLRQGTKVDYD
jgi:hypothetical protein